MRKDKRIGRQSQLNSSSRHQTIDLKLAAFSPAFSSGDEEASEDDSRKIPSSHPAEDVDEPEEMDFFSEVVSRLWGFIALLSHPRPPLSLASPQSWKASLSYHVSTAMQSPWVWRLLMFFSWVAAILVNWRNVLGYTGISPIVVETSVATARYMIFSRDSKFWQPTSSSGGDGEVVNEGNGNGGPHGASSQAPTSNASAARRLKGVPGVVAAPLPSALLPTAKSGSFAFPNLNARANRTSRSNYLSFSTPTVFFYEMGIYFIAAFLFLDSLFLRRLVLCLFFANTMQWADFTSMMSLSVVVVLSATLLIFQQAPEVILNTDHYRTRFSYAQHAYFSYSFALLLTSFFSSTSSFQGYRAKLVDSTISFLRFLQRTQQYVLNYVSIKSSSRSTTRGQNWFDFYSVLFLALWYTIVMCEWSLNTRLFSIFYFILAAPVFVSRYFRGSNQNSNFFSTSAEFFVYLATLLWLRLMVPFNETQVLSRMMRTALIILFMVYKRIEKMEYVLSSEFYVCLSTLLTGFEFLYFPCSTRVDQKRTDTFNPKYGLILHKLKSYSTKFLEGFEFSRGCAPFFDENLIALGTVCFFALVNRRSDSGKERRDAHQKADTSRRCGHMDRKSIRERLEKIRGLLSSFTSGRAPKSTPGVVPVPAVLRHMQCKSNPSGASSKPSVASRTSNIGDEKSTVYASDPLSLNDTPLPLSRKAKIEDSFLVSSHNSLNGKVTSRRSHNTNPLHSPGSFSTEDREDTAAKLTQGALLESHLTLKNSSISDSYRPSSIAEVVDVNDTLRLESFGNGCEIPTTVYDVDSGGSVGSFAVSEPLTTSQKAETKAEKELDQGESKSEPCDSLDLHNSALSHTTKQSDPNVSMENTEVDVKETLSCFNVGKTISERQEEKTDELISTSEDPSRRNLPNRSTDMGGDTSLGDTITSFSSPLNHPKMEGVEPHLGQSVNLADQVEDAQRPTEDVLNSTMSDKSLSKPLHRALSRVASTQSVESVLLLSSHQSSLSGQSRNGPGEIKSKKNEVHIVIVESRKNKSDTKRGKQSEVVEQRQTQLPPQKQSKDHEQKKSQCVGSKLNERDRQTKEQDKRQIQSVTPCVEGDPPKPLPPGSKLKTSGPPSRPAEHGQIAHSSKDKVKSPALQPSQHPTNPKLGGGLYSTPTPFRSEKPRATPTAAVAAPTQTGVKPTPAVANQLDQTSKTDQLLSPILPTAKLSVKPISRNEAPIGEPLSANKHGNYSLPQETIFFSADRADPLCDVFDNTTAPALSGARPSILAVGNNQPISQASPFSSLSMQRNSHGTTTTEMTKTRDTLNHTPSSFLDSEAQIVAPPNQKHSGGSSGNLFQNFFESHNEKDDLYFVTSDQRTPVKVNECDLAEWGKPACATDASSDDELDLNFNNGESIAELLSAVARMTPKNNFESKEVFSGSDSIPFFSGPDYLFSTELDQQQKQSPVGVVAQRVGPTETNPAFETPRNANYLNSGSSCPLTINEWSVINSESLQLSSPGPAPGEGSQRIGHTDQHGCTGNLPASHTSLSIFERAQSNPNFGVNSPFGLYSSTEEMRCRGSSGAPNSGGDAQSSLMFSPRPHPERPRKASSSSQECGFNSKPEALQPGFGRGDLPMQNPMPMMSPMPGVFLSNPQYRNTLVQQQMTPLQLQPLYQSAPSMEQQDVGSVRLIPAQPNQLMAVPMPDGRMGLVRVVHPMPAPCFTGSMRVPRNPSGALGVAPPLGMNVMPFPMFMNSTVPHSGSPQTGRHQT